MPTFATPEPIAVRIDVSAGWVRLVATDRDDTVVSVLPGDESRSADVWAVQHTRVDFRAGTLIISGTKRALAAFRGGVIDVEIGLPARSRLQASLASATMRAEGEYGDVKIAGATGAVELEVVRGALKANNASGSLTVHTLEGSASVATASGDATIGELHGSLKFNGVSGSLSVDRLNGQVKARTVTGAVSIAAAVRGALSAHTNTGEVALGVARGTAARLDIVTSSGVVNNDLDPADGPQHGDETFVLNVRSNTGDVRVHRADPARRAVSAT